MTLEDLPGLEIGDTVFLRCDVRDWYVEVERIAQKEPYLGRREDSLFGSFWIEGQEEVTKISNGHFPLHHYHSGTIIKKANPPPGRRAIRRYFSTAIKA